MTSTSPALEALGRQVAELLLRGGVEVDDDRIQELARQLGEPLTVVLMGEFNSGKSALVNALLGTDASEEGVVPTTDRITMVTHGEPGERVRGPDLVEISHPAEMLRNMRIVDTPGTNSILDRHDRVIAEFLHRADLVLFVISAERGFSRSERDFLEFIRGRWDRKLLCALNKVDLLDARDARKVEQFVRRGFEEHLDVVPRIHPVSARKARRAREQHDQELLAESGVAALLAEMDALSGGDQRQQLKFHGTISAFERIVGERVESFESRRAALRGEVQETEARLLSLVTDHERTAELLAARWRAAVDLAFWEQMEAGVQSVGRIGRFAGPGTGAHPAEDRLSETAAALIEEARAWSQSNLTSFGVDDALPVVREGRANQSGLNIDESDRSSADRRLAGWTTGSALAAAGLVVGGVVGLVAAPISVLGAAGAGVASLWRRDRERALLAERLSARRDELSRLIEKDIRDELAVAVHVIRAWVDPGLAAVRGEQSELCSQLAGLERLLEDCAAARADVEAALPDADLSVDDPCPQTP